MALMKQALAQHYKELPADRQAGQAAFLKVAKEQTLEDMRAELEGGEQLEEGAIDEQDIEEQFNMEDIDVMEEEGMDESYIDIDESDYTQLIDKERF